VRCVASRTVAFALLSAGRHHRAIEVLLRSVNMKQALLPPNDLAIAGAGLTPAPHVLSRASRARYSARGDESRRRFAWFAFRSELHHAWRPLPAGMKAPGAPMRTRSSFPFAAERYPLAFAPVQLGDHDNALTYLNRDLAITEAVRARALVVQQAHRTWQADRQWACSDHSGCGSTDRPPSFDRIARDAMHAVVCAHVQCQRCVQRTT
jgi:hypothetical protein